MRTTSYWQTATMDHVGLPRLDKSKELYFWNIYIYIFIYIIIIDYNGFIKLPQENTWISTPLPVDIIMKLIKPMGVAPAPDLATNPKSPCKSGSNHLAGSSPVQISQQDNEWWRLSQDSVLGVESTCLFCQNLCCACEQLDIWYNPLDEPLICKRNGMLQVTCL